MLTGCVRPGNRVHVHGEWLPFLSGTVDALWVTALLHASHSDVHRGKLHLASPESRQRMILGPSASRAQAHLKELAVQVPGLRDMDSDCSSAPPVAPLCAPSRTQILPMASCGLRGCLAIPHLPLHSLLGSLPLTVLCLSSPSHV